MLTFVSAAWLQEHLDSPEILVLDPRSPLRYMAGHPKGAVNAPIAKARDASGALLPLADLERWLGSLGLDDARKPVIYDHADGRNAAMLAWILLHLGREDVHLMESFWESWVSAKREIFYRPVAPVAREFHAHPRPQFRATIEQVTARDGACLLDFRSTDEFSGKVDLPPGAPAIFPARSTSTGEISPAAMEVFLPSTTTCAKFSNPRESPRNKKSSPIARSAFAPHLDFSRCRNSDCRCLSMTIPMRNGPKAASPSKHSNRK